MLSLPMMYILLRIIHSHDCVVSIYPAKWMELYIS